MGRIVGRLKAELQKQGGGPVARAGAEGRGSMTLLQGQSLSTHWAKFPARRNHQLQQPPEWAALCPPLSHSSWDFQNCDHSTHLPSPSGPPNVGPTGQHRVCPAQASHRLLLFSIFSKPQPRWPDFGPLATPGLRPTAPSFSWTASRLSVAV